MQSWALAVRHINEMPLLANTMRPVPPTPANQRFVTGPKSMPLLMRLTCSAPYTGSVPWLRQRMLLPAGSGLDDSYT